MKEIPVGRSRLQVLVGDITRQETQAVVNAANRQLAPGGGVAGAIHLVRMVLYDDAAYQAHVRAIESLERAAEQKPS